MYFRSLSVILGIIFAVSIFLPNTAFGVTESAILVNVAPPNPAPGETVNINLNSYSANLDTVLIMWTVNGSATASGIGRKSFSVNAGTTGTTTNIMATIFLPSGEIEKRITLRPSALTLLWQANDSYVPPFYKGKALPSADTEIKVVAMPEIISGTGMVNAKSMTYAWKKDYTNDQQASGYGKNYMIYTNDYLDRVNSVEVTASTTDQRYSSRGSIVVPSFDPKISFYRVHPLYGTMFNNEILNSHFVGGEEVIRSVPYFISPKNIQIPTLLFNWYINGNIIRNDNVEKHLIPLRVREGVTGTSRLRLEIEDTTRIFQSAVKEINIQF